MTGIVLFVVAILGRLADGLTTAVPPIVGQNNWMNQQPIVPFEPTHTTQGTPFEPPVTGPSAPFEPPVTGPPAPFEPPVTAQASFSEQQPTYQGTRFEQPFVPQNPPFIPPPTSQGTPVGEPPASRATPFGPDCSQFQCSVPTCLDGSMPTVPAGKCCPTCTTPPGASGVGSVSSGPDASVIDPVTSGPLQCSEARCTPPVCSEGVTPVILPGECCSTCPEVPLAITTTIGPEIPMSNGNPATGNSTTGNLATGNPATGNPATGNIQTANPANSNCDLSQCQVTRCPAGSTLVTPAGGCCPQCVTDTTMV
ncbi:uncharacterized protein DDB_G0274171-like [Dreissena polymorpha]|nr:uncharacterized protein DDB_G0274171-like [Dreissena polymorpha]